LLTAPLMTVTSEATKPVTISEKTTFTVNGALVGVGAVVENWLTVGAVPSKVRLSVLLARLLLPAVSSAAPAAMESVTLPSAVGVTSNV